MLDVRTPIALMFAAIGALLMAYGLQTPAEMYKVSLGYNLNVWWGLAMLSFAVVMFAWQKLNPQELEHHEEPVATAPPESAFEESQPEAI